LAVGVIPGGFPAAWTNADAGLVRETWPIAQLPSDVKSPSVGVNEFGVESVLVGKARTTSARTGGT
jgi:hypothetical protein